MNKPLLIDRLIHARQNATTQQDKAAIRKAIELLEAMESVSSIILKQLRGSDQT